MCACVCVLLALRVRDNFGPISVDGYSGNASSVVVAAIIVSASCCERRCVCVCVRMCSAIFKCLPIFGHIVPFTIAPKVWTSPILSLDECIRKLPHYATDILPSILAMRLTSPFSHHFLIRANACRWNTGCGAAQRCQSHQPFPCDASSSGGFVSNFVHILLIHYQRLINNSMAKSRRQPVPVEVREISAAMSCLTHLGKRNGGECLSFLFAHFSERGESICSVIRNPGLAS